MSTESYDVHAYVVELRARIRELEAELAQTKDMMYGMDIGYHMTVETLKAHVAVLERERDGWKQDAAKAWDETREREKSDGESTPKQWETEE